MDVLDLFVTGSSFNMIAMTGAIMNLPRKPGAISARGMFEEEGITTTSVMLEEQDGVLSLLSNKRRGAPGNRLRHPKRRVRTVGTCHLPVEDEVLAESLQNAREFGTGDQKMAVSRVVAQRMQAMVDAIEVTLEYHRAGALNGIVLDADGSTELLNLFDTFGVVEQTVDFVLDDTSTNVRQKCVATKRLIEAACGRTAGGAVKVEALCSAAFFDALVDHEQVRDAYHRWNDSAMLRNDPREGFDYGGIRFSEYEAVVGSRRFIPANSARFFPVNVPGIYKTFYAPASTIDAVNTLGLRVYASQEVRRFRTGIDIKAESNPLNVCLRPKALVKGTI